MDPAVTCDMINCPCVQPSPCSNRLRACNSSPVLCTSSHPNPSEEHEPCLQKGGELGDSLDWVTRDSDTPSGDASKAEVVSRYRVSRSVMAPLIRQSSASLRIGLQESDPSDSHSVELESKESTKEGTPVGLRTRSRVQQQQTVSNNFNEEGSDKPIEPEIKELLLQLISQAKEQQLEMKELRQAFTKGLEQQESIVHGLKEDITALHMQIQSQEEEQIDVYLPISEHPPLVRPLTRSVKLSI